MDKLFYEIVVSLNSGKQLNYSDVNHGLVFQENFNYDSAFKEGDAVEIIDLKYDSVVKIFTGVDGGAEDFNNFKSFCQDLIEEINMNNNISNIVIKDSYGNVYYNILGKDILEKRIEVINEFDRSLNKLRVRFYIYLQRKQGE